jgi:hypothetical protein
MRTIEVVAAVACAMAGCHTYAYRTFDSKPAPRSVLADQPAVRNRMVANAEPISWNDIVVTGELVSGAPPTPAAASVMAESPAASPEKVVVELWIDMQADNVSGLADAVTAQVEKQGGRVVSSNVVGGEKDASSAALELRVPPAAAAGFVAWLASRGEIESRRTLASDVSKLWVDQELELENLELTMRRLEALAAKDVPVKELLEIETEMTRVRGEIERVKGEQRWLADRVELATVTLSISREGGAVDPLPHARVFPGAHVAALLLLDPAGRDRARAGGGASLYVRRAFTFDLDLFPGDATDSRALVATFGTAMYSGYLGFGRRRYLNPYLGARVGYGYLSGEDSVVFAGELGVELVRHRYMLVEASARAVAFVRDARTDGALQTQLGVAVPF